MLWDLARQLLEVVLTPDLIVIGHADLISRQQIEELKEALGFNIELLNEIQQAWEKELASVSQGAFVSREQYIRSLDQRINLKAQKEDNSSIWPMNYHCL